MSRDLNPLGFREIFYVTYSEKAFNEEGREVMNYMAKKNGMAADDTPILRTMDDLRMMMKYNLIDMGSVKGFTMYAVAPIISDPTKGAIAPDAYLWFAAKDGAPLPAENIFAWQFGCLQKTGNWCKE
jgi:hypothetical protein